MESYEIFNVLRGVFRTEEIFKTISAHKEGGIIVEQESHNLVVRIIIILNTFGSVSSVFTRT